MVHGVGAHRPGLYRDYVLEAGWTPREWVRWVTGTLTRDLLPDR